MERVIQDELLSKTQEFLNATQHGFIPGKSCTTNLIMLTDNIANNLAKDIGTDIIYFDFAKAFDTVNHDLLLTELKNNFEIEGRLLKFITNYLKDRRQRVVLDNAFSEYQAVSSGVPQGSILGLLLFVVFINDINTVISPGTNICLYADDTKIWREMHTVNDCKILQNDKDSLDIWCKRNQMRFHPEKCKVVSIISNSNRLFYIGIMPFSRYSYTIGNTIVKVDLGVTINDQFTWTDHHQKIITKASQMLGLIKHTSHFIIPSRRKRTLYLSMVRSQFEHCSVIWCPVTASKLYDFVVVQKNAIK